MLLLSIAQNLRFLPKPHYVLVCWSSHSMLPWSMDGEYHYAPYSVRMSPENTHKLMGFLYGGFNTRHYSLVHGFCFFKVFPIGCTGI